MVGGLEWNVRDTPATSREMVNVDDTAEFEAIGVADADSVSWAVGSEAAPFTWAEAPGACRKACNSFLCLSYSASLLVNTAFDDSNFSSEGSNDTKVRRGEAVGGSCRPASAKSTSHSAVGLVGWMLSRIITLILLII